MSFDLEKILESKRAFRQQLATRPIEEKLAMLDALRERAIAIRAAQPVSKPGALHEQPPPYRVPGKKSG
jgi:hypothetical protein